MPKMQKCPHLKEVPYSHIRVDAGCYGTKDQCPKSRMKCHVTATCWKVSL